MIWAALIPVLGKVLDKAIPDQEARDKAKLELQALSQSHEADLIGKRLSAILAEANSKDPWTSRARPAFLYVMYFVILSCFVGGVLSVWHPDEVTLAAEGVKALLGAIPEWLYGLFGVGYLGYTGARSYDKRNIIKAKEENLPWLDK